MYKTVLHQWAANEPTEAAKPMIDKAVREWGHLRHDIQRWTVETPPLMAADIYYCPHHEAFMYHITLHGPGDGEAMLLVYEARAK